MQTVNLCHGADPYKQIHWALTKTIITLRENSKNINFRKNIDN